MARTTSVRLRTLRRLLAATGAALTAGVLTLAATPAAHAASASAVPSPSSSAAATPSGSYAPVGTAVKGGTNPASSGVLSQPGQYTDTLESGSPDTGSDGTVKYYSIVLHKGDNVFMTATLVPPDKYTADGSITVDLEIASLDESLCYFSDSNYQSESGNAIAPFSVVVATGVVGGPDWNEQCPVNGTYTIKVTRSGDGFRSIPMPLELGYHVEPKVVSSGVPGIAASGSDVQISAGTDQARTVSGGFSYDDAPVVGAGTYRDTITSGETRYFRVPLTWGQRMAFFVASDRVTANKGQGAWADAALFSPIRTSLYLAEGLSGDYDTGFGGDDSQLSGTTRAVVRYANRESTDDKIAPYSIAGDYYFAMSLGYPDDGTSLTVPYTMQLRVLGAPETAPSYSYSAVAQSQAGSDDSGSNGVLWVLVVIVLVVVVAVGWLVLVRRRRPAHAGVASGGRRSGGGSGLGSAPTTGIPTRGPPPAAARPSVPPRPSVPQQQRPSVPPGPSRPSGPYPQGPPSGPPRQGPPPGGPPPGPQQGPPPRGPGPQQGPPRR